MFASARVGWGCLHLHAQARTRGQGPTETRLLDVVVTHPAAPSYVDRAAKQTGSAAKIKEDKKRRLFTEYMGSGGGYEFVPLAVESFGRMGAAASRFLSDLGSLAAQGGANKAHFVRNVRAELSCALARGIGRMYNKSLMGVVRSAGGGFTQGAVVPVDDVGYD